MRPHYLAFRRTLPGGMIVLVSLEIDPEGVVHGMLQVERRVDPSRQLFDTAHEVLKKLRTLAENDAELAVELARWEAAHPSQRRPGERFRP